MTDTDARPETEPAQEPEPDRPTVEVVEPTEPAQAPAVREKSALEHAAEELMATPGAPGREEFLVLATTARVLSMSAGAPPAVRNNPWLAFHLALIGRDLGISPSASLALIDVIGYDERKPDDYSKVQLSLSPELLNAQIKRMGLGSIVKAAATATECTAVALLPGGRLDPRCARRWPEHVADDTPGGPCRCTLDLVLGDVEFTWEDGQQARLIDHACTGPDAHTAACMNGGQNTSGKRCHQGYRTYPKRMMWWRASSWCQSDYFPEAGVGLYSPEELGATVDPETGRPVDPATVALPEGYEQPERPHDPADDLLADAEDDSELGQARRDLRARIDAVAAAGEEPRAALVALWEQEDDEGGRRTPPFARLQRRHLVRARAVVKSVEDQVKRGNFGDDAKAAWADASVSAAGFAAGTPPDAQAAPKGPEGVDSPSEAPVAATGADSAPAGDAGQPAEHRPRPSKTAQQVREIRAAVAEMADEEVTAMVEAFESTPAAEESERRMQLVALLEDAAARLVAAASILREPPGEASYAEIVTAVRGLVGAALGDLPNLDRVG